MLLLITSSLKQHGCYEWILKVFRHLLKENSMLVGKVVCIPAKYQSNSLKERHQDRMAHLTAGKPWKERTALQ